MMKDFLWVVAIVVIAGCGSADRAAPSGRFNSTGGASAGSGTSMGGEGDGGAMAEAGASSGGLIMGGATSAGGTSGGTGGTIPDHCDSDGSEEPVGTFECATNLSFANPVDSGVVLEGGTVVAISSDGTTFITKRYGSSSEEFFLHERADTMSDFGAPLELLDPERPVGLSPDGLSLFVVDTSGAVLAERSRGGKFEDFGPPSSVGFQKLNQDASDNSYLFAEVVVSSDGKALVYAANATDGGWGIYETTRQGGGPWDPGTPLSSCEFGEKSGLRRRPLRLSDDKLTLFMADDVRGIARAAYRGTESSAFTYFRSFPETHWLAPHQACDGAYWMAGPTLVFGEKLLP